ncbi:hypothetical protein J7T55_007601 [Diaporthe amygdali]|uniref:uncharacterized protein n=1 Tax=Phomopsis amygdali TaxID=1214568 RepID=UPI0022FE1338|nr:uncharacterized protein J7T55_007601 [Diaporthe amygdali]KAJ0107231.1 hypothetical protein J7T55_007601 [Diaporthe amygdali]
MTSQAQEVQPSAPFSTALYNGLLVRIIQTIAASERWYRWAFPSRSNVAPSLIKTYTCRPSLSVRIFRPTNRDRDSSERLPCYFNIHGGGFCLGSPEDDDEWNRAFADKHSVLVVELDYRKAPAYPFPTAIHDVEALMLAVYGDESLPLDNHRIAVGGFSSGGSLALAVCQLQTIRDKVKPMAVCPIYPLVDLATNAAKKAEKRYYKPELGSGRRANATDVLSPVSHLFGWSYVPYGQHLKDPLLSPFFAPREHMPKKVFIVAAELDRLAHEAWRMASVLARRPEPSSDDKVGQEKPGVPGKLILDDERFAFKHVDDDGREVQWLLIPDQIHGFDLDPVDFHGSQEAFQDAQVKTEEYQKILGEWLHNSTWTKV